MGRVIPPVEVAADQIPEPGAHQEAAHFLLDELYDKGGYGRHSKFGNWGAHAIMIYGSTTSDAATIRSDLDVIIQPFGSLGSEIIGTDALSPFPLAMAAVKRQYRVHPEPHYLPGAHTTDPIEHPLDPFYVDHLLHAQDDPEWSRNWPVDAYTRSGTKNLSESQLRQSMRRYLGRKVSLFTDAVMHYDGNVQYDHMQRALELPTAIGRKFVRIYTGETEISREATQEAVTSYLLSLASSDTQRSEIAQSTGWRRPFSTPRANRLAQLLALNSDYDEVLAETIHTGQVGPYEAWINAAYRPVIELAGRVAAECISYIKSEPVQLSLSDVEAEIARLSDLSDICWDY